MMLLLALLPALAMAANTSSGKFIVEGTNQDIADFPFQGSYRTASNSHTCGCVFVGGNYVLTAGHCGGTTSHTMQFGSSNQDGSSGVIARIASVVRHPNYDQGAGFTPNDISVVTATSDIGGPNVAPASIPSGSNNPGGNGWITGWGRTCGSCGIPVALQGREMPIISDTQCSSEWGSSFQSSSMICVLDGEGGACNGDSGGPLSVGSTVYGLASWVRTGCVSASPSVYARVGAFYDWVCQNTNNGVQGC